MKLIFTMTGRNQWYVAEAGKPVVQVDAETATALMENGVPVEYR